MRRPFLLIAALTACAPDAREEHTPRLSCEQQEPYSALNESCMVNNDCPIPESPCEVALCLLDVSGGRCIYDRVILNGTASCSDGKTCIDGLCCHITIE